jgi:hypothetical protein
MGVSDEERIREHCTRLLKAKHEDWEREARALGSAITEYLQDQSDEIVLADLLSMPEIAAAIASNKYAA